MPGWRTSSCCSASIIVDQSNKLQIQRNVRDKRRVSGSFAFFHWHHLVLPFICNMLGLRVPYNLYEVAGFKIENGADADESQIGPGVGMSGGHAGHADVTEK